jgi:TolA-binding protein
MNRPLKIALYIICVTAAVWFGLKAKAQFRRAGNARQAHQAVLDEAANIENTNIVAESTNAVSENTNAVAMATNDATANTNVAANTNIVTTKTNAVAARANVGTAGLRSVSYSRLISYVLICVLAFGGLALLLARDISYFVAGRAEKALFNDEGAPVDPEYEQAEELWKDAKYLDAIQAMRDYLKKNPREQYVALRIAEIYEENLSNPLAAALEYEEVLKKNLPAERWGWAAIHLANIYSGKLSQPDKAIVLLHRIDSEYGTTSAAIKARERLTQIDPNFVSAAAAQTPAASEPEVTPPVSNLPPGFRPKE